MVFKESISTCRFAQRVAMIKNDAIMNEELDPKLVKSYFYHSKNKTNKKTYCLHLLWTQLPKTLSVMIMFLPGSMNYKLNCWLCTYV